MVVQVAPERAQAFHAPERLRTALITGSTDGIGQHTAERLARDGWEVLIHGRNPARIAATLERIKKKAPEAKLHAFQADFANFSDIRHLASDLSGKFSKLDLLVNNAGVFAERMQTTADGNEYAFQVNVLSPFLLTALLLDAVAAAPEPRIIITSSISQSGSLDWDNLQMEKGFSAHGSYSSSKLCNAMHTMELSERLKTSSTSKHVTVNTLDPGTVNTKMLLAGWGECGIEVEAADNQFELGTSPKWKGQTGVYTCGNRESRASRPCYDPPQRRRLWKIMERLTDSNCP
jgi:NAD(P)-dependent dehydrogenase (short-subunit alcohol dehydrogenase family)